nr:PREDICTED: uncharacterized protein LOC109035687 [Bemisia tabaci]
MAREEFKFLGQPFDPNSIMMWPYNAFRKPGLSDYRGTISSKSSNVRLKDSFNTKLSDSDVARIRDLYQCVGNQQNPRFPVDVVCSFDDNDCGFKGLGAKKSSWRWIPWDRGSNPDIEALNPFGNLVWSYNTAENFFNGRIEDRIWSVGFSGLSPLDKDRGPEGCITFKYLLTKRFRGLHRIKLVQVNLWSPLDATIVTSKSIFESSGQQIWYMDTKFQPLIRYRYWIHQSVRVNVGGPFMLYFESIKEAGGKGTYTFKIDDLAVRYTPCEEASCSDSIFRCFSGKSSRTLSRSSSTASIRPPKK